MREREGGKEDKNEAMQLHGDLKAVARRGRERADGERATACAAVRGKEARKRATRLLCRRESDHRSRFGRFSKARVHSNPQPVEQV